MQVELGFLEKASPSQLQSKYFPSKVGGYPAWLNLQNLPTPSQLQCDNCKDPCVFLLQMYSPGPENKLDTFHRTLFIFMCKNPGCCLQNKNNGTFKVFRCQLGRSNKFYDFDPPSDNDDEPNVEDLRPELYKNKFNKLCAVCGCAAPKHCANCKNVFYCSRCHQQIDWKAGHKSKCQTKEELESASSSFILSEFELVNETEEIKQIKADESKDYEQYEKLVLEGNDEVNNTQFDTAELEQMAMKDEDKMFGKFKKLIASNPDQVLRYQRNGTPVWLSNGNLPSDEEIPDCECGSKRTFEFQVLPQLLNHLKLDSTGKSIDWGLLVVYTCKNDCNHGDPYHEEFLIS